MTPRTRRPSGVALLVALPAAVIAFAGGAVAQEPASPPDPSQGEVSLPAAAADWTASLVIDRGDVGIWTIGCFPLLPQYGCPEVIGLDDEGRVQVLVSYSGKWTPNSWVHDGKWLGGLAFGELDPRVSGAELYTGGQKGNLYQLTASPQGVLDARRIAWFPGRELHTLVVEPGRAAGDGALLAFTRPGALYRVTPTGAHGRFESELVQELAGRVRDALVIPPAAGSPPSNATVSRAGQLALLEMMDDGPRWTVIHQAPMGMGRIAVRGMVPGDPLVLYTTLDDGRVLRHQRSTSGSWSTETIYLGPQGPRGIASGRFHADPAVETVAVFGYSARVQLLTRNPGGWDVETLFIDRDKGHWLEAAELDGRNSTDELLASGYGGRLVLLARPPGYGRDGIATAPAQR